MNESDTKSWSFFFNRQPGFFFHVCTIFLISLCTTVSMIPPMALPRNHKKITLKPFTKQAMSENWITKSFGTICGQLQNPYCNCNVNHATTRLVQLSCFEILRSSIVGKAKYICSSWFWVQAFVVLTFDNIYHKVSTRKGFTCSVIVHFSAYKILFLHFFTQKTLMWYTILLVLPENALTIKT